MKKLGALELQNYNWSTCIQSHVFKHTSSQATTVGPFHWANGSLAIIAPSNSSSFFHLRLSSGMGVEIFDPGVPPIFGPPALSIGGVGLVRPDWVEFIQLSKGATETPVPEDTDGYGEMEPPC